MLSSTFPLFINSWGSSLLETWLDDHNHTAALWWKFKGQQRSDFHVIYRRGSLENRDAAVTLKSWDPFMCLQMHDCVYMCFCSVCKVLSWPLTQRMHWPVVGIFLLQLDFMYLTCQLGFLTSCLLSMSLLGKKQRCSLYVDIKKFNTEVQWFTLKSPLKYPRSPFIYLRSASLTI